MTKEFEHGDKRYDLWIIKHGDTILSRNTPVLFDSLKNNGRTGIKKGCKSGFDINAEENYPLIRYADILLMYAECNIMTGNFPVAYSAINKVRERAFGTSYKTVQTLMEEKGWSAFDALKHERRVELCFEGHRYNDLIRWGDAQERLEQRGWNTFNAYHPLPEIFSNNTSGTGVRRKIW